MYTDTVSRMYIDINYRLMGKEKMHIISTTLFTAVVYDVIIKTEIETRGNTISRTIFVFINIWFSHDNVLFFETYSAKKSLVSVKQSTDLVTHT